MRMSDAFRRDVLTPSEGVRLIAYRDIVGVLTIGVGHTSAAGDPVVKPGMRISAAEADAILAKDLRIFEDGVWALIKRAKGGVQPREFDALTSLAFNIGLGAFKSSSLLRAYNDDDKPLAADKFLQWNRAGGRVVAGLVARRRRERDWFLHGHQPAEVAPIADFVLEMAHMVDHPDNIFVRLANMWSRP